MKVLSLFDGMSCGQIALNRLGIEVDTYYASEIDKYAMEITQKNFPKTIQIGDVCAVRGEDYQDVDLILAGSPCQGFSFAGKQLAFDDPRSALFFEFIRLLKEIKPKYFLLENVKMKKDYLQIISEQVSACYPEIPFGIEPIFINSSLVSAQSRQRYYWTNIPNITQPEERGIVLRDILEDSFDIETDKNLDKMTTKDGKAFALTTTYGAAVFHDSLKKKRRSMIPTSDSPKIVAGAWRGRSLDESGKNVKWKETKPKQMLETRKDEKSNAVSTFTKDNVVVHSYREVRTEEAKQARRENRQKTGKDHTPFRSKELQPREDGKVGTVTPGLNNDHRISLTRDDTQEVYWRKLTPLECERLQTVPDVEKNITILLCLDQVKNFVNAVDKNPKLLKLVLSAEKSELKEYVSSVVKTINPNHQPTKYIVQQSADIKTQMQTEKCIQTNLKEKSLIADIVANKTTNNSQKLEECSATLNVFINSIEGKIINVGKVESRQNDKILAIHQNGRKQSNKYGIEIMQLVKDVEQSLLTKKDSNFISTISSHLSLSNLGQMLTTSYFFAKSAIDGLIPKQTQKINLSFQMIDGYTEGVSNTQRYKMLGNGWTVEVICHILKNMEV